MLAYLGGRCQQLYILRLASRKILAFPHCMFAGAVCGFSAIILAINKGMFHPKHKQRHKNNRQKNFTVILISILLAATAIASGFFLFYPLSLQYKEGPSAKSPPAGLQIRSFRGVLSNALGSISEEIGQIKEQISGAAHNPFADAAGDIASSPASPNSFSFAILGDTQSFKAGNSSGNFQRAIASVKKLNPNMVFAVGDLVGSCANSSKCEKDYSDWKNIIGSFMPKTYTIQGNHDRTGGSKADKVWQSEFSLPTNGPPGYSEITYSFNFKNSHFVVLASDNPAMHDIDSEQRSWLEKDLAANKQKNTFVFFHEPAFPVSSKIGESLDKHAAERNTLWQILDNYNVTAVFNGHEHIVSRRKIYSSVFPGAKNSIYQLVFGDTDSFDHALPAPGIAEYAHREQGCFGFVKVSGQEITVETHDAYGNLLDTFTFSK